MNAVNEMKETTLYYREGASDKVYQCRVEPAGERFVVTFAYGRRGSTLNTGTKTNVPVSEADARRIYEKLIKEKKAKGYTEGKEGTPFQHTEKEVSGILPQLLTPVAEKDVAGLIADPAYCAQEKWDGRRLLIRKTGLDIVGINKQGLTVGLPTPLIAAVQLFEGDVVLDGESVGDTYHGFDLLMLDGVSLRDWPYRQRLLALMNLLFGVQQPTIRYVETAYTPSQKQRLLTELKANRREGIVFKRLDAPSTPGRSDHQLKYKFIATVSAVVGRINARRSVEIRLLNEDDWQPAGNVTIPANQVVPQVGEVVEVQYLYAHRQSHVLYQPVYRGLRMDVAMQECRLSQLKYKADEN